METTYKTRTRCQSSLNQPTWSRRISLAIFATLLLVPFSSAEGGSASATAQPSTLSRADRNRIIYVSDFDVDPANFKQDKGGITGKGYLLPAPPKSFLRRKHQDRTTAANNLIRLMSETLVADLNKAGLVAERLSPADPWPTEGLVLSGVFTELSEGNQMRRALFGFGSGKAKVELYIMLTDVSSRALPLYESSTQKSNGKVPGAVIAMNPYAGAAGFVVKFGMTKNAPEKTVKKTASKVAAQIIKQLETDTPTTEQALNTH